VFLFWKVIDKLLFESINYLSNKVGANKSFRPCADHYWLEAGGNMQEHLIIAISAGKFNRVEAMATAFSIICPRIKRIYSSKSVDICDRCHGEGRIRIEGTVIKDDCPRCDGRGEVRPEFKIHILMVSHHAGLTTEGLGLSNLSKGTSTKDWTFYISTDPAIPTGCSETLSSRGFTWL